MKKQKPVICGTCCNFFKSSHYHKLYSGDPKIYTEEMCVYTNHYERSIECSHYNILPNSLLQIKKPKTPKKNDDDDNTKSDHINGVTFSGTPRWGNTI